MYTSLYVLKKYWETGFKDIMYFQKKVGENLYYKSCLNVITVAGMDIDDIVNNPVNIKGTDYFWFQGDDGDWSLRPSDQADAGIEEDLVATTGTLEDLLKKGWQNVDYREVAVPKGDMSRKDIESITYSTKSYSYVASRKVVQEDGQEEYEQCVIFEPRI